MFVKGTFDNNYLHKQYLQMWFGLDAVVVDDVAGVLQPQPQRLPAAVIFVELVELDYQHPLRPQRMEGLRHLYMLPPKIVWCLFMDWSRSFHVISMRQSNYLVITGCPARAATVAGVCGP